MGRWRRKLGVVLGVFAAVIFVASTTTEGLASAATNLFSVPDQDYSPTSGKLQIPDYFKPADVVIDQNEIYFYEACANYNGDSGYGTSRYSVTINNNPTYKNEPLLQCMKHTKKTSDGRRLFEDSTMYSIGIKPKYSGSKYISSTNHDYSLPSNVSIDIVSQDAAHDRFNENKHYDLIFHITDIKIVTGTVNNVKSDRGDTDTGIGLLFGTEKVNGKSKSEFCAEQYVGHRHLSVGVKYNVTIELIDRDAEDEAEQKPIKTAVWMLADIDIAEKLKGEDASKESKRKRYTYSSEHTYAEHVKLISGGVKISEDAKLQEQNANDPTWHKSENMIPVSVVPCKTYGTQELGIASDGAVYHKNIKHASNNCVPSGKYSGNVSDNSTDALFKIKINDASDPFKFEWGGSGCGTTITSAPYVDEAGGYYNYELKPYVTNHTTKAAYIGSSITMEPGVVVATRRDTLLSDDNDTNTYATITKETEVKYSYWFTDAAGNIRGGVQEARETETRRFNDENNGGLSIKFLENTDESLEEITIEIDDSQVVGGRVCVELSVYPFESHDGTNNIPVSYKETSDISTRRATASCLPIAKRPTMSVESSNVYSATNIHTLIYGKKIGSTFYNFGSWSEYGVFGRVNSSTMMASGAALGYSRNGYTGGKALNTVRNNPGDDGSVATENNSNECTFMTQTFANVECKQSSTAASIGNVTADQYRDRMIERYQDYDSATLAGLPQKQFGSTQYMDVSNIDPTAAAFYKERLGFTSIKATNLYLSKTPKFAEDDHEHNHTIVYHATNLVIDGNLNVETAKPMSTPRDLTGVVIIADNVYVTDRTTYINATIIADELNTCAFRASNPSAKLKMSDLSAGVCNQSVIFDQPVITKRLILNRTAGANGGTGSIVRAEVFNLNSGNFLWSFNQMSRYSQAITTFARELPPRY